MIMLKNDAFSPSPLQISYVGMMLLLGESHKTRKELDMQGQDVIKVHAIMEP